MSEDIFMLYQKEIDALVKRGYKDAFLWLKEASVKFPDASIQELLAAANSLVKENEVFTSADATDTSDVSIPSHKHVTKATINKVKNKGVDSFWEEKKASIRPRTILHPERVFDSEIPKPLTIVDVELKDMNPVDSPIFFITKEAINSKVNADDYNDAASEVEAEYKMEVLYVEKLEAEAAKLRLEAAEAAKLNIVERKVAAEKAVAESKKELEEASQKVNVIEIFEDEYVDDNTISTITIKNKEYVAPSEMTVDNSVNAEYVVKKKRRSSVRGKAEASTIGVEDTVEEFVSSPEKNAGRAGIGSSEASQAVEGAEVIELEDNIMEGDVNLTIKNKEYVAPSDMTVDNSIKAEYVVSKKSKPVKAKRSFFRREKIEEGTIGVSDSAEVEPISPILAVSQDSKDSATLYLDESEKAWDTEITGKLTEKTMSSDSKVKIKDKEYVAPSELVVDNTLPAIEKPEQSEKVIIEFNDKVIESPANLTLKNKQYIAPADMTIDNSLSSSISSPDAVKPKRPIFSRKSKESNEVKVVYLPAKPIDKSFVASPRAEHIEGMPVYRPMKKEISNFIDEDMALAVAAEMNATKLSENAIVNDALEEEKPEETYYDIDIPEIRLPPKPIDFSAIAKEIEMERAAAAADQISQADSSSDDEEAVAYYSVKSEEEIEEYIEEEYAAELSAKAKNANKKNKLDNIKIIKDIKAIDGLDF